MANSAGNDAGATIDADVSVKRYRNSIYHHVLRLVGDRDRADDLTQETFLRVCRRPDDLKDAAALPAWPHRIATNIYYDYFRTSERRQVTVPVLLLAQDENTLLTDDVALHSDQLLQQSERSDCMLRFLKPAYNVRGNSDRLYRIGHAIPSHL
ncbi:MAG TPA: RNA polymerase sigma factor [Longimicrobiales bacterium]